MKQKANLVFICTGDSGGAIYHYIARWRDIIWSRDKKIRAPPNKVFAVVGELHGITQHLIRQFARKLDAE